MPVIGLAYDKMPVGVGRYLGKVSHDDDLRRRGQRGQTGTHVKSRPASHAGINLVEDKGGDVPASGDDLKGQHDP